MKVLIDTNVIIDALVGRQPYYSNADKIIKYVLIRKLLDIWQHIQYQIYFKERLDRKRKTGVIVKFM